MQPVILDTDVASLLHKRKPTGALATRLIGRKPLITFVTYGELTKWMEIRHWGTRSRQELADWLADVPVLPGDEAVATTWGRLSAAGIQRGRPRPTHDMWIAASALTYDLPLATLHLKDYEDFRLHHGLRVLGAE
ncbi:type II toxin-antitoxin system VapC family toxin [Streptomyces heliomycini]|uniref:Type II toxin-antitoxin system VapC family toxin n=1 Tax=Streptomyces heliomycini TaxID=284032 RepID=A0ABV5LA69_9ACTN